jgi:acetyl-CoA carboxylase biotin carboxyl carrier protein
MQYDIKELKKLIALVEESKISELSLEDKNGEKVLIKKSNGVEIVASGPVPVPVVASASAVAPVSVAPVAVSDENEVAIKSPMVGTYYASANPDSPPYVKIGDHVKKGDTIGIVEAMKLFNEIESEVSGTVTKILVNNATPVEYGQPLILIQKD